MLSISRQDLFKMKIEFRQYFKEFFRGGIEELEKTILVKMYAM